MVCPGGDFSLLLDELLGQLPGLVVVPLPLTDVGSLNEGPVRLERGGLEQAADAFVHCLPVHNPRDYPGHLRVGLRARGRHVDLLIPVEQGLKTGSPGELSRMLDQ